MSTTQTAAHLIGEALIAALAHRLLIALVELALQVQLGIADGARKVVDAPCLVQGREHISSDDLVAHEAQVAKQQMVVGLAVR